MKALVSARPTTALATAVLPAVLVWVAGWMAMLWLDGTVDLANLAMLLVLCSALASLWLPGWASAVGAVLAVATFNWAFVPPRHTFSVDLRQHALLLLAMLGVSWIVSALVVGQRRLAATAQGHAQREQRLRAWGDTLRAASDPAAHASALHDALATVCGTQVAVQVHTQPDGASSADVLLVGEADADQHAGLGLCCREGRPLGLGSGRYEEQPDVYLPLRGRSATLGAAVLRGIGHLPADRGLLDHAQALCDQLGQALERVQVLRAEQRSREQAQEQGVRNALLAAISHDYRTPLATILGAASALEQQADRMDVGQRRRLASTIVEEVGRLGRLTDNTLQLARLDAPGVELRCDWESAEEIVGAALRRARRRDGGDRVRARLEPGLPLLWCDTMLVSQLLDNLVDNALKYSPAPAPVEVLVRRYGERIVLAVRDRGPGVEPAWRERVFDVFRRGVSAPTPSSTSTSTAAPAGSVRAGAGVGLAVSRAIARAHGGELTLRARSHGGCSFEFALPLRAAPPAPAEEAAT